MNKTIETLQAVNAVVKKAGESIEAVTHGLIQFKSAIILLRALFESGDWPDYFSLLNRHVRTDFVPENISGQRWQP